jgi:hypothetical protein
MVAAKADRCRPEVENGERGKGGGMGEREWLWGREEMELLELSCTAGFKLVADKSVSTPRPREPTTLIDYYSNELPTQANEIREGGPGNTLLMNRGGPASAVTPTHGKLHTGSIPCA